MDVKIFQKVFFNFWQKKTVSKFSFLAGLGLGILKIYPPIIFQNPPNFGGGGSKNLPSIRIFDDISERYMRFTKEEAEV